MSTAALRTERLARLWSPANGYVSSEADIVPIHEYRRKCAIRTEKLRRLDRNHDLLFIMQSLIKKRVVNNNPQPALPPGEQPLTEDGSVSPRVTVREISVSCCRYFNVSLTDITSARRTAKVVRVRMIAMYLARMLTLRSLPEIGDLFGKRDHTTVLHAFRKIEAALLEDGALQADVAAIRKRLGVE